MDRRFLIFILAIILGFGGIKQCQNIKEQQRVQAQQEAQEAARKRAEKIRIEAEARAKAKRENEISSTIWGQVYNEPPPYMHELRKMKLHDKDR